MALFEYRCPEGHITSLIRHVDQRHLPVECEVQGCGMMAQKILSKSNFAILFRPGYFDTIGERAETEMEFNNKYSRKAAKLNEGDSE